MKRFVALTMLYTGLVFNQVGATSTCQSTSIVRVGLASGKYAFLACRGPASTKGCGNIGDPKGYDVSELRTLKIYQFDLLNEIINPSKSTIGSFHVAVGTTSMLYHMSPGLSRSARMGSALLGIGAIWAGVNLLWKGREEFVSNRRDASFDRKILNFDQAARTPASKAPKVHVYAPADCADDQQTRLHQMLKGLSPASTLENEKSPPQQGKQ